MVQQEVLQRVLIPTLYGLRLETKRMIIISLTLFVVRLKKYQATHQMQNLQ